jgi:hypothetical protein
MKRIKRTFTPEERCLVFDLWKQGAGFSDIGALLRQNLVQFLRSFEKLVVLNLSLEAGTSNI